MTRGFSGTGCLVTTAILIATNWLVFIIAVCLNVGMWFERFVIIVGSLYQTFLPSNWGVYYPTWVDAGIFLGTLGAFFMLYLLFVRFLPMIPVSEVKAVTPQADPHRSLNGLKGEKP